MTLLYILFEPINAEPVLAYALGEQLRRNEQAAILDSGVGPPSKSACAALIVASKQAKNRMTGSLQLLVCWVAT